jgi:ESCRT-II complex subunit VPS36
MEPWSLLEFADALAVRKGKEALLQPNEFIVASASRVGLYDGDEKSTWPEGQLSVSPYRLFFEFESSSKHCLAFLPLNFVGTVTRWRGFGSWSHPKLILPFSIECSVARKTHFKASFRGGGMDSFLSVLMNVLEKQVWKHPIDEVIQPAVISQPPKGFDASAAGIVGLERRTTEQARRKQESLVDAMKDVESIMAKAHTVVEEINQIHRILSSSEQKSKDDQECAVQIEGLRRSLGLPCPVSQQVGMSRESFHNEVAEELRRWMNMESNPLNQAYAISIIDLYAMYNRARGGLDLLSPMDMRRSCESLQNRFPEEFCLFQYRSSGLVVLQRKQKHLAVMQLLRSQLGDKEVTMKDIRAPGAVKGITDAQFSQQLKVSVPVGRSVLEDLEQAGELCRSEDELGRLRFHWNLFNSIGVA